MIRKSRTLASVVLLAAAGAVTLGCSSTPPYGDGLAPSPAPLRQPPPDQPGCDCYEDSLTGGQVFTMYCSSCHNARPLSERPFSNYKNVAAHMRLRANLTGKEYAKLVAFLREVQDVPPPVPPVEPGPKRLIFSRPIAELRDKADAAGGAPKPAEAPPAGQP
jgi:hypothetical protein